MSEEESFKVMELVHRYGKLKVTHDDGWSVFHEAINCQNQTLWTDACNLGLDPRAFKVHQLDPFMYLEAMRLKRKYDPHMRLDAYGDPIEDEEEPEFEAFINEQRWQVNLKDDIDGAKRPKSGRTPAKTRL